MKILFITPGSGDSFYCGNCFRDNLQARALRKAGHEVIIMPLYLPFRQASFQADTPLFFPATTFYTAQKFFSKRAMPKWLERWTASDRVLQLASSLSGITSAEGMEGMTLAMITGDDPAFHDQVSRMIDWIRDQEHLDVIHLSSSLLIGIAKAIKAQLSIPIVCSVQDEEVWIDSLADHHASAAWQGIRENKAFIDRFITTSEYYKKILRQRIPHITEVDVVYPGVDRYKYYPDVDCDKYNPGSLPLKAVGTVASDGGAVAYDSEVLACSPSPPVIGFFYRMNRLNGLDILAEAFVRLKQRNTISNLRLKIGGGYTAQDKPFLKTIIRILSPYMADVEIDHTYSLEHHAHFFRTISVLSVPLTFEEGVGLYLCEAFAAGCPAVEPATGSFPEIVADAGIIYEPNNSDALANALEKLLTDDVLLAQCRTQAFHLSATRYNDSVLAERLSAIYHQLII